MSNVSPTIPVLTLEQLIARRVELKRAADKAAEPVKAIDQQIIEMLRDPAKSEGSISQKAGDYKVTVTFKVNRNVDTESLQKNWASLPENVQEIFKWKADVTVANLRALDDKGVKIASKYFESKPASPGLKIEVV